jgi:hypothetical protein
VFQGSFSKVTPDLKYADLITCGKCNFKWFSNHEGIFGLTCPQCKSTKNIIAELNQERLAQGANFSKQQKVKELKKVIDSIAWSWDVDSLRTTT